MAKHKNAIHIVDREDAEATRLFWKNKTPEERLSAVEFLPFFESRLMFRGPRTRHRYYP